MLRQLKIAQFRSTEKFRISFWRFRRVREPITNSQGKIGRPVRSVEYIRQTDIWTDACSQPIYQWDRISRASKALLPNWNDHYMCTRINHEASHVVERTDLPDELIVDSQGTEIFSQELPRVGLSWALRECAFLPCGHVDFEAVFLASLRVNT